MVRIGNVRLLFWPLVLFACLTSSALAGVVTGELDSSSGTMEDQFVYTLTLQGSADGDVEFPKVDGLEVRRAGTSQSMSIVNGQMSREVSYQFILLPNREGTFTIPPIKVKIDGKFSETLPLELKVGPGGGGSGSGNSAGNANPRTAPGGASEEANVPGLFVERSFSKTTAYVGEAISVKVKLYNRLKVAGAQTDIQYPTAFQEKPIEPHKTYREVVNGEEYDVTELNTLLIPNREGDFKINPAMIIARVAVQRSGRRRGMFDDFFGGSELREKRLRTSEAALKILPLPVAGRRKDFSGLIGEFRVSGDLSPRSANTGDSINLDLIISGLGSAAGMSEPTLPVDNKILKVYKDKADYKEVVDGDAGIESQKTFKYALVPKKPGTINLGEVNIQTFNPKLGSYQDLTFDMGSIEVGGTALAQSSNESQKNFVPQSSGAESSGVAQKAVELKGQDMVEPHEQDELRGSDTLTTQDLTVGGISLGLSLSAIAFSSVIALRRRPDGEAARIQRANKAFKQSKKHLDFAQQCLRKQNLGEALRAAQTSFKAYAGAKFDVVGSAVTLRDMETYLKSRSVSRETLLELREVWSALDQMIYAPPLGQNPTRGEELLNKSRRVLVDMERQCKRS